ncbi:hypothetical protein UFOVP328_53 [uncultured Caudovirales phage]|uniref:Uncharacterized protein n=1 Tax=uncultured Caudovirales phage TaxID=2100421 RepID=A0A6J5LX56_9CAUD|nr:hypothetical protein UFOVP328_53 [uncultured Caudovirales phage]
MGFIKRWDVDDIATQLHRMGTEAASPYNDGWTASTCKYELYQLKCLIDDIYRKLPTFAGEDEWEKQRVAELLKRKQ